VKKKHNAKVESNRRRNNLVVRRELIAALVTAGRTGVAVPEPNIQTATCCVTKAISGCG
jgi:hypothetical protein